MFFLYIHCVCALLQVHIKCGLHADICRDPSETQWEDTVDKKILHHPGVSGKQTTKRNRRYGVKVAELDFRLSHVLLLSSAECNRLESSIYRDNDYSGCFSQSKNTKHLRAESPKKVSSSLAKHEYWKHLSESFSRKQSLKNKKSSSAEMTVRDKDTYYLRLI